MLYAIELTTLALRTLWVHRTEDGTVSSGVRSATRQHEHSPRTKPEYTREPKSYHNDYLYSFHHFTRCHLRKPRDIHTCSGRSWSWSWIFCQSYAENSSASQLMDSFDRTKLLQQRAPKRLTLPSNSRRIDHHRRFLAPHGQLCTH